MNTLRTPEACFAGLDDYPFDSHYLSFGGLRLHYVDEGPDTDEVILCLHGEPTWSYLYRKIIPVLAKSFRVLAPDFIGCGKSDKFADRDAYSFDMHFHALSRFVEELDLDRITLVCHDWGGLLGLTLASQVPEAFDRLVIMNTGLPCGDEPMNEAFMAWRAYAQSHHDFAASKIIAKGLAHPEKLSDDEYAAYDAPFPDNRYKTGIHKWPSLVPIRPDDPGAAELRSARNALKAWEKPALALFSDKDPLTADWRRFFEENISGLVSETVKDAGHFLQEDKGEEIAARILRFVS